MYLPVRHNKVAKMIYDCESRETTLNDMIIHNQMIPLQEKYTDEFVEI